jgi:tripartite motif-containing protein 43/48/49/64/77
MKWAAEEYREKLLKKMDPIWKMTKDVQNNQNQETTMTQSFDNPVALKKGTIKSEDASISP